MARNQLCNITITIIIIIFIISSLLHTTKICRSSYVYVQDELFVEEWISGVLHWTGRVSLWRLVDTKYTIRFTTIEI